MKYIVKKPFGNVKVGEELETDSYGMTAYAGTHQGHKMPPAELALMLNAGFLEESDGKWRPKSGDEVWMIETTLYGNFVLTPTTAQVGYNECNCFPTKKLAEAKLAEINEVLRK